MGQRAAWPLSQAARRHAVEIKTRKKRRCMDAKKTSAGDAQRVNVGGVQTPGSLAQHSRRAPIVQCLALALLCAGASVGAHAQSGNTASGAALAPKTAQPARQWVTPPAGDVQKGAALYQERCTACHAIDSNKTGPAHRGVMGRRVGSLVGYTYSVELARSRLRWTPQTLNVWLEDPEELVAGQRMGFQVEDPQERADLIAYLATLK